ncbi:LacI family DNA-binding transcriptional regulator [Bifidobacterium olomucense]|uniref:LacI family transcriptional regulator n=1 Tax=Bifidobacterium olomucense TaxID=2675324 RepID=A0A7Y0HXD9_9BIFI|nr:LacI family DNA-binding transcriptional regulator [Bifidobacterium sp. DSM 109959]NMM98613.1 LacI family transcriptional regulator [Bifidobacterium sp. DSM 109959]
MVGMRDVARKAGVSVSTVSLVVNNAGYVSTDMRAKVEAAMRELDYIPNELARNLYRDRTDTVGVIVPTIAHPFFASLTSALQHEFAERGLKTLLCSTVDADKGEAEYVDMLQRHMMDGIVMAAHTAHPADYWTSIGRPIVAFDRYLGPGIPSVDSDHEQGGRLIARQLIDSGARHVVLIGGPRAQFHDLAAHVDDAAADGNTTFPTVRYYLTLEHELDAAGVRHDYVEAGEVSEFAGYAAAARELFDRFDDVDAVVSSDTGAALCVQEAIRRGLSIPHDLQIIAYDGTYVADAAGLRLSVIRQDFAALASVLASRLSDCIAAGAGEGAAGDAAGNAAAQSGGFGETVVPVTFVPGETTR